MSAHNFLDNAFYWEDADRFRASYLTAWNVRGYGIYVEGGRKGTLDHDYVSGAADAAYYIGECNPCQATVEHVVATAFAGFVGIGIAIAGGNENAIHDNRVTDSER